METRLVQCANCGAEIDLMTGLCPYCSAEPPGDSPAPGSAGTAAEPPASGGAARAAPEAPTPARPAAPPLTKPTATPASAADSERVLGLLLFEAEESLARGSADKALVLASRAVKDRPDSLTARALLDRARRELLRGRRLERLESRVQEARGLLEAGEVDKAERIVTSALKLIPDHAVALELFARLKERRLAAPTAEAEAERELAKLAQAQAKKALDAARAALAAGWERRAFAALREGLRHVPDDPQLLALLREAQKSMERLEHERARRRALHAQVRAGLDLLAQGQLDESLKILRAVLREDPENARAQAAVQQVRQVWLTRSAFEASATPAPATPAPAPPALTRAAPPVAATASAAPAQVPTPTASAVALAARPTPTPAPPARSPRPAASSRAAPGGAIDQSRVPVEIRLPATRRRATPIGLVLGCGAAILVVIGFLFSGRGGGTHGSPPPPPARTPSTAAAPPAQAQKEAPGPLTGVEPDLRQAIESALAAYARALESADGSLLAQARPDLSAEGRERVLAPFRGALNAATEMRILNVATQGDEAEVTLLRSDVIIGGGGTDGAPVEETLRFRRQGGAWALR